MTLAKSEDIISKLNELINKINFQPIPFKKLFFAVSSYNDSINFPAITNIKRIQSAFFTMDNSFYEQIIHENMHSWYRKWGTCRFNEQTRNTRILRNYAINPESISGCIC